MTRSLSHLTPLGLLVLAASCGGAKTAKPDAAGAAAGVKAPVTGEIAIVAQQRLDAVQHVQGELTPNEAVDVYARVNGYVREIPVDRGSVVHKGDVVARLDAPELLQQRTEAEARLVSNRQTVERLRVASGTEGAVSGHEVEVAEAALRADSARVASLREMEGYLIVRAPFEGVVTDRRVHPGALVGPSQGSGGFIVRIEDHTRLRLTVAVPEQVAGVTSIGVVVAFSVSAWPGQVFHGRVARASGAVETRTRTMPIELDVASGGKLAPGMFADVAWPVSRRTPSLFVPPTAIVQTTARTYVIRVRAGKAELVDVTRGVSATERIEVFGALAAGDTLLRRGTDDVAQGESVSVRARP